MTLVVSAFRGNHCGTFDYDTLAQERCQYDSFEWASFEEASRLQRAFCFYTFDLGWGKNPVDIARSWTSHYSNVVASAENSDALERNYLAFSVFQMSFPENCFHCALSSK